MSRRATLTSDHGPQLADDECEFLRSAQERYCTLIVDAMDSATDLDMRTNFCARCFRDRQEVVELCSRSPLKALGDIRRNRNRSSAKLIGESTVADQRFAIGRGVNGLSEVGSSLPRYEIFESCDLRRHR
jgi:hypothetical protein